MIDTSHLIPALVLLTLLFAGIAVLLTRMLARNSHLQARLIEADEIKRTIEEANRKLAREIQERKLAEETLGRLATAVEQAFETIVITAVDGTILYVNPAFERTTGFAAREAIGQNPRILKSDAHNAGFYRKIWETILAGGVWSGQFVNRRKDGTLYTEDSTISPIRDETGQVVNFVAVKRDITQELRLAEQLRQAQKMEAIGQLAGGVAHDFNNLLQGIMGYTQIALDHLEKTDKIHHDLEQVLKAGERATVLVRQLLSFSRRQNIQRRGLDLNQVIGDLMKMLRRVIGEHIDLQFSPAQGVKTVFADPGQIEQILMNLCVNARDAMIKGGRLAIATRNAVLDKEFCANNLWASPGEFAVLRVSDNGCGMAGEVREHIFEPFFTTKDTGKGTGLGLATVYGIVKQHNGLIDVASAPGHGARFDIYLPANGQTAENEDRFETTPARGGNETILLAEDDEIVRNLAVRILRGGGYRVLTAQDGEAALLQFARHKEAIDLVILDVVMPRLSGRAAHERIVALRPGVPVLFSSGYSMQLLESGIAPADGARLIQKPYEPDDLLRTVRETLDQRPKDGAVPSS
jgi:PAS domain S-box-containing protein